MKLDFYHAALVSLVFAITAGSAVSADDADDAKAKKVVKEAEAVEAVQVVVDVVAAPAVLGAVAAQVVVEAVAVEKAEAGEQVNLELFAAPLQMLFGGGAVQGAVAVQMFAAPVAAVDLVAQNEAMVQQFVQQFRPFLTEELSFVRLICSDLTMEQRPKIKAAGEAGLKQSAKDMADMQNGQNQLRMAQMNGKANVQPEPRRMIREAVAKALQETLTEQQMTHYTREAANRTAHRKQGAIMCVVSRLDGCLFLTTEQRNKIMDEISSNWQDKWEQWLMMSAYGDQYFPVMPDQHVVPHLNADQKSIWQGLQKIDFGVWWGGGNQNQPNDNWWGDQPVDAEAMPANGAVIFNFQAIGF